MKSIFLKLGFVLLVASALSGCMPLPLPPPPPGFYYSDWYGNDIRESRDRDRREWEHRDRDRYDDRRDYYRDYRR
jgi:hypothetical protein